MDYVVAVVVAGESVEYGVNVAAGPAGALSVVSYKPRNAGPELGAVFASAALKGALAAAVEEVA